MNSETQPILDQRCIKTHNTKVVTMLPELQEFDLIQQIIKQLALKNFATKPNILAQSISNSIGKNPNWLIIANIRDMAKDNYNSIANLLGVRLTESIINFK